jgi:hypothetical protein
MKKEIKNVHIFILKFGKNNMTSLDLVNEFKVIFFDIIVNNLETKLFVIACSIGVVAITSA